ncbi:MAG: hypothetical protein DKT66_00205 [Candidatus Melainabacteria bacterium]|nr:MAG: hypothetical protein DKT66_00205 [Candidatus Melainabacteria bacterium]
MNASKRLENTNKGKHRKSAGKEIGIQQAMKAFTAKGSLVQNALCVSNYEIFVRKIPLLALQVLKGKGRNRK